MHWEAIVKQLSLCAWRPLSCKLAGRGRWSVEIQLEAIIDRVWRCTLRPWSMEIGDMHLQAGNECVRRCTWRAWSSALAVSNWVRLEIHFEVVIERVWRFTWRPGSIEIGQDLVEGRGMACLVLKLYSSVRQLDHCTLLESWPRVVDHVGRHAKC